MRCIKLLVILIFCFATSFSFSQGEFLIEIDTSSGSFKKIGGAINGITWVYPYVRAYDETHGVYIFQGGTTIVDHLYSIDVANGSVISAPYFPPSGSSVREIKYDNSKDTLYGLYWDSTLQQFFLASVNRISGIHSQVSSNPVLGLSGTMQGFSAYDDINHRYFTLETKQLFTINTSTGSLISSTALNLTASEQLLHFCYNSASNVLNGLMQDSNTQLCYLVSINTATGAVTKIGNATAYGIGGGSSAIDTLNQRYLYTYTTGGSDFFIVTANIKTGNIISNKQILLNGGDNIHSIAFDNVKGKLFGIQWDALITSIVDFNYAYAVKIFPVPANNSIVIRSSTELGSIIIYNTLGEVVLQTKSDNMQEQIDLQMLAMGVYTIYVQGNYNVIIKE